MEEHKKDYTCRELWEHHHAAKFCSAHDVWLTKACVGYCPICAGRPERPSEMAKKMLECPSYYRVTEA